MIDFTAVADGFQYLILGGVIVAAFVLWKTRGPKPESEIQRGYDDAKEFHMGGVNIWEIRGYVRTASAMGAAGPYEKGMVQYINEILKVVK